MEIINPPIIRIGNRLYRKNPSRNQSETLPISHLEDYFEESCVNDKNITEEISSKRLAKCVSLEGRIVADRDKFVGIVYVPKIFHKSIVGWKASIKHKIEQDFTCKLFIPKECSPDSYLKVSASLEADVTSAVHRISWLVANARSKHPPNYFICLPVSQPSTNNSFNNFMQQVLFNAEHDKAGRYTSVDRDLFISQTKLHFTICTLLLADDREISCAMKILENILETDAGKPLQNGLPLQLTIRGFDYMNDEPKSVSVLYAALLQDTETARLQTFSNSLADIFTEQELHSGHRRMGDPVKLHMTVMNSRLRCERQRSRCTAAVSQSISSEVFSAVGILNDFGDRSLVEKSSFNELHLCKIRSDSATNTSYYPCITKLTWT